MTLPVSKYEELLETVRSLKHQTIRVRELASPLLDTIISANNSTNSASVGTAGSASSQVIHWRTYSDFEGAEDVVSYVGGFVGPHQRSASAMESLLMERQQFDEDDYTMASHISSTSEPGNGDRGGDVYRTKGGGTWPAERAAASAVSMWHSEPSPLHMRGPQKNDVNGSVTPSDMNSVMSFASSSGAAPLDLVLNSNELNNSQQQQRQQQLDVKVDMVYSLLAVLGTHECPDMGETLLALSSSPDSSRAMRQAGCLSILVQLVHARDDGPETDITREKASKALRNLVQGQVDERAKKRELKVLRLLEEIRLHCTKHSIKTELNNEIATSSADDETNDDHPTQSTENIIKLSFDEGYRHTICELGGIYTLSRLLEVEHSRHGALSNAERCITLRRYTGMALTNLTFGHGHNKSLLCSFSGFMRCLVAQLTSGSDELRQVTASVLRNLSWRADPESRTALRQAGAVGALMHSAIKSKREATLKSVLSALWNLSAHCSTNKADICAVPGALSFLVDMLGYRPPSRTLAIIENAGGILRNVSSHIAIRDDYRAVLRERGCLPLLLQQLKSPSLTVVSNACGALWNLSAKCEQDQRALWEMGAAPMLRSLNHSKHVMIATGSRAALKNLLSSRPPNTLFNHIDSTARELGLPALPTLGARKQRALQKDLDQNLAETCDNIEPTSPNLMLEEATKTSITTSAAAPPPIKHEEEIIEVFGNLSLNERSVAKEKPANRAFRKNFYEFEQDNAEQPVDYSRKYSDTGAKEAPSSSSNSYGDYAETDLDQPTDYSLRYAENIEDSDDDEKKENPSAVNQFYEGQLDSVKTYCTEGTPYETPRNFSTATSMSDLRIDEEKKKDLVAEKKLTKSGFSSGLMTPEKPVKYCEEGTPRSFSRVSSFSSLNLDDSSAKIEEKGEETAPVAAAAAAEESNGEHLEKAIIEEDETESELAPGGKVVTFGSVVDCGALAAAEQTPLMFSRCSSLGSLSSAEQHSIHDDRSSVISDFSRLTSGIVSPSELPDSPTQTVPPSPRHRKGPLIDFPSAQRTPLQSSNQTKSVFEDHLTKFKEVNTPVEFSTNTSLSSLTIDDEINPSTVAQLFNLLPVSVLNAGHKNTENIVIDVEIEEEEDEQAEDDMLAACINIGIQNNRHRQKKQQLQEQSPVKSNPAPAAVVRSAIPHRTGIPVKSKLVPPVGVDHENDFTRVYCTEDTPAMLSHAGSHSDLSVLSVDDQNHEPKQPDLSDDSSNLSADNESNILAECIQSGMPQANSNRQLVVKNRVAGLQRQRQRINKSVAQFSPVAARDELESYAVEDSPCQFSLRSSLSDLTVDGGPSTKAHKAKKPETDPMSRAESLSSLSVESFGSTENAEQALLEQCISSGMPPKGSKNGLESKNGLAASVAERRALLEATGEVAAAPEEDTANRQSQKNIGCNSQNRILIDNWSMKPCLGYEENLLKQEDTKNGHDVVDKCAELLLDGSVEENNANAETSATSSPSVSDAVQNRMFDPDAMIESLDRFTAELVSQSSHLQHQEYKLENVMQHSNGDTWNEDTSPNDVSFPSISVSVPLVASFTSDCELPQPEHIALMSDSTLIAIEASKLAKFVRSEAELQCSVTSLDLEHVKPPSVMDSLVSLTSSISELDSPKNSPLMNRKRSLPVGVMARRALMKTSLENLSAADAVHSFSSSCNLDHMKPPSVMGGDFLDLVDMENSMLSVASITSEVAEPGGNGKHSIFDFKQHHELIENFGPPSLLNEQTEDEDEVVVTDMCNSTADVITDHIYSETEVFEDCFTHTIDHNPMNVTLDDVTITEYSDANSLTPVQSDFATSSAESTPKKSRNNLNNRMTPKQRRQLAKERYKTYTVAAEMVIKEECKNNTTSSSSAAVATTTTNNMPSTTTLNCDSLISSDSEKNNNNNNSRLPLKLTPKERRQLDRDRFQTRVLDGIPSEEEQLKVQSRPSSRSTMRQRRLENRERFRTRTLSGNSAEEDLHVILAQQANIVLDTLHADELLDCETLSLVSNDDDSEHNSVSSVNYRTYHKSWGFSRNLPVVKASSTTSVAIESVAETRTSACSDEEDRELDDGIVRKPKIVKPEEKPSVANELTAEHDVIVEDEKVKAVRGRRKPLYSSATTKMPTTTTTTSPPAKKQIPTSKLITTRNMKPLRTMTSNLVKNVTTTLKTTNSINKLKKPTTITTTTTTTGIVAPFIKHSNIAKNIAPSKTNTTTANSKQMLKKRSSSNGSIPVSRPLERQGTFTKEDKKPASKIPESRIPTTNKQRQVQSRVVSSSGSSATAPASRRASPNTLSSRSPSADRDFGYKSRRNLHGSSSSQSLQSGNIDSHLTRPGVAVKRSSIPNMTQRSHSNVSNTSNESVNKKKPPVASRIAGLWKKSNASAANKTAATSTHSSGVRMRKKSEQSPADATPKRLSRLGSFIQVEEISVT